MPIYDDLEFGQYVRNLPAASEADLSGGNNMPLARSGDVKKLPAEVVGGKKYMADILTNGIHAESHIITPQEYRSVYRFQAYSGVKYRLTFAHAVTTPDTMGTGVWFLVKDETNTHDYYRVLMSGTLSKSYEWTAIADGIIYIEVKGLSGEVVDYVLEYSEDEKISLQPVYTILKNYSSVLEKFKMECITFEVGGLDESGAEVSADRRFRTNFISFENLNAAVVTGSGIQYFIYGYDENKDFVGRDIWRSVAGKPYIINVPYDGVQPPDFLKECKYFRLVLRTTSNDFITEDVMSGASLVFKYKDDVCGYLLLKESGLNKKSKVIFDCTEHPEHVYESAVDLGAEVGTEINFNFDFKEGHTYVLGFFFDDFFFTEQRINLTNSALKFSVGKTGDLKQEIFKRTKEVGVILADSVEFTASVNYGNFNIYVGRGLLQTGMNKIHVCVYDKSDISLTYSKPHMYQGEKLNLYGNPFGAIKIYSPAGTANGHAMQAFDIWNDVVFQCYDSGICKTYNLLNGQEIAQFYLGSNISTNHCGNANFGRKFFAENSSFPALYVSGDLTNLTCYVESVTATSSTLKQKIVFELTQYKRERGSQVILDLERERIVYMQRKFADYARLDNVMTCTEFALPALTDGVLTDGVLVVTMTDNEVLDDYELPEYRGVYQGACINNGKLFELHGYQNDGHGHYVGLMVFDLGTKAMTSYMDFTAIEPLEPQGVCVYNGKLFVNFIGTTSSMYQINV